MSRQRRRAPLALPHSPGIIDDGIAYICGFTGSKPSATGGTIKNGLPFYGAAANVRSAAALAVGYDTTASCERRSRWPPGSAYFDNSSAGACMRKPEPPYRPSTSPHKRTCARAPSVRRTGTREPASLPHARPSNSTAMFLHRPCRNRITLSVARVKWPRTMASQMSVAWRPRVVCSTVQMPIGTTICERIEM